MPFKQFVRWSVRLGLALALAALLLPRTWADGTCFRSSTIPTTHTPTYFRNEVYPAEDTHIVRCDAHVPLQACVRYDLSFWMKTEGYVQNPRYWFSGSVLGQPRVFLENQVSWSGDWNQVQGTVSYQKSRPDLADTVSTKLFFAFNSNGGTVWVTGFTMKKSP